MGDRMKQELQRVYREGMSDPNLTNDQQAEKVVSTMLNNLKITIPPGTVVINVVGGSGVMNPSPIVLDVDSF